MTSLERAEQAIAWELRGYWMARRSVACRLSDRCLTDRVSGRVSYVSVTGAFAVIDGWHIPCADILSVHRPHYAEMGKGNGKGAPGSSGQQETAGSSSRANPADDPALPGPAKASGRAPGADKDPRPATHSVSRKWREGSRAVPKGVA